ncbi:hypothetical protein GCM10022206_84360 [Streptomyces chiangmaiensis]
MTHMGVTAQRREILSRSKTLRHATSVWRSRMGKRPTLRPGQPERGGTSGTAPRGPEAIDAAREPAIPPGRSHMIHMRTRQVRWLRIVGVRSTAHIRAES